MSRRIIGADPRIERFKDTLAARGDSPFRFWKKYISPGNKFDYQQFLRKLNWDETLSDDIWDAIKKYTGSSVRVGM